MTVVDASTIVRVLASRADDDPLRERFTGPNERFDAPHHLDIEVISAITGLVKGGKIDTARATRMITQLSTLHVTRHPIPPLGRRILELRTNFTAYDAAYIALAERLDDVLFTTDQKFARAPTTIHSAQIETFT